MFFLPDSIVAIAAAEKSIEAVWFIKIVNEGIVASDTIKDNYGNSNSWTVLSKRSLFGKTDHYSKRLYIYIYIYKINKNLYTIFFKESIVFPFVQFVGTKKGLFLSNKEYTDILMYVERSLGQ